MAAVSTAAVEDMTLVVVIILASFELALALATASLLTLLVEGSGVEGGGGVVASGVVTGGVNLASGSGVTPGCGEGVAAASCADLESFFFLKYFK